MGRLSKDAWKKASLKTKEVEIEELGGSVLVRELPAAYSAAVQNHITMRTVGREQIGSVDLVAMERLKFAYGVVGEDGEQLFSEDEAGEIATRHGRAFKRVLTVIDELSDIDEEALQATADRFPVGGTGTNHSGEARSAAVAAGSS